MLLVVYLYCTCNNSVAWCQTGGPGAAPGQAAFPLQGYHKSVAADWGPGYVPLCQQSSDVSSDNPSILVPASMFHQDTIMLLFSILNVNEVQ